MKRFSREYLEYINSPTWRKQRLKAFQRWGRACNACGVQHSIEVHHLVYRNLYDVETGDLMPLCVKCHNEVHEGVKLSSILRCESQPHIKREIIIEWFKKPELPRPAPRLVRVESLKPPVLQPKGARKKRKGPRVVPAWKAAQEEAKRAAQRQKGYEERLERLIKRGLVLPNTGAAKNDKILRKRWTRFKRFLKHDRRDAREEMLALIRSTPPGTNVSIIKPTD